MKAFDEFTNNDVSKKPAVIAITQDFQTQLFGHNI